MPCRLFSPALSTTKTTDQTKMKKEKAKPPLRPSFPTRSRSRSPRAPGQGIGSDATEKGAAAGGASVALSPDVRSPPPSSPRSPRQRQAAISKQYRPLPPSVALPPTPQASRPRGGKSGGGGGGGGGGAFAFDDERSSASASAAFVKAAAAAALRVIKTDLAIYFSAASAALDVDPSSDRAAEEWARIA